MNSNSTQIYFAGSCQGNSYFSRCFQSEKENKYELKLLFYFQSSLKQNHNNKLVNGFIGVVYETFFRDLEGFSIILNKVICSQLSQMDFQKDQVLRATYVSKDGDFYSYLKQQKADFTFTCAYYQFQIAIQKLVQ
eukprot:TRINITY_DN1920_c3_g1_i2.p3 TRINITY_DN1920_c3_g1~~TRINITY_DN1920_c3_g1_i2.p3  ORF type:complete len:135 (-),score=3.16 TRINITY_DN1920_c3_g1_i2:218-622(-)